MEKVRKAAAVYFLLQGVAVVAWWILLISVPASREWFRLDSGSLTTLWAFWLPDLLVIFPVSLAAAGLVRKGHSYGEPAAWLVTGAVTYATLYTTAMAMMTDRGWLGVVLMMPATIWSGVFATGLTVGSRMFRAAKDSSTNYVLVKTFTQIIVVWALILAVIPYLISIVEEKLGGPRLEFAFQRPVALVLFVAVSSVGVWAALVMSRVGKGTPLPLDHASNLVVTGPYRYVRNPMAVSGILQGLCVALFLGSPFVAIYALTGSAIWQLIFRPLEEDELEARFGKPYGSYRDSVRCWIPSRIAYQIDGTCDSSNSVEVPSGSI